MSVRTDEELEMIGISRNEYDALIKKHGEGLNFVRASEPCELRAHRITNPTDEYLEAIKAAQSKTNSSSSSIRLEVGRVLQAVAAAAAQHQTGYIFTDAELPLTYHHAGWHTTMTGHIDGIAHDPNNAVAKSLVVEIKTTSDERFNEILAATDFGEVESELLESYLKQMRRYAAMLFLTKKPYIWSEIVNPMFGLLVMMNRNSCEVATREVPLFEEGVDFERFLEAEIESALGNKHPNSGEVDRPSRFFRGHPICETCAFKDICDTPYEGKGGFNEQLTTSWALDFIDGDRYEKLGALIKKRVKASVVGAMDAKGIDKLKLNDAVSVSRFKRGGRNGKVDYEAMKKDGVYDKYVATSKPFTMVRFNVKR